MIYLLILAAALCLTTPAFAKSDTEICDAVYGHNPEAKPLLATCQGWRKRLQGPMGACPMERDEYGVTYFHMPTEDLKDIYNEQRR